MKVILLTLCSAVVFFGMVAIAHSGGEPNVFLTSAGPVKITPLNHASTLIEAGGKTIYLDPAKPVKFSGLPKADLILITDIHGKDHMIRTIHLMATEIYDIRKEKVDGGVVGGGVRVPTD